MRYNGPFEQLNRLFEQTRRSTWHSAEPVGMGRGDETRGRGVNPTVEQTDDGYVVMADLPGFGKGGLALRFGDGVLTITGESTVTEDGDHAWRRQSRRVSEQVTLPAPVVEDEITASYHNGVLEVRLPTERAPDEDDEHTIHIE